MKHITVPVTVAGLALMAALAACGGGSGGSHAEASAHALASSLSSNPALQKSEKQALRKLQGCTDSGTKGQLTWSVNLSDPQHPQFQVTHMSLLLAHHLRDKMHAVLDCASPPGERDNVKACVAHLGLPTSKEAVGNWFVEASKCIVAAPQ